MSARNISVLLLVLNSLAWSTLGIYIRVLGEYFPILQQIYLRVILAGALVGLLGMRQIRWRTLLQRVDLRDWLLIIVRTSCMYLLGVGFSAIAYLSGEYSTVSLIKALPMAAIFGLLIFREPTTLLKLLFIFLSFLGALLLLLPEIGTAFSLAALNWGWAEAMAFLSVTFLAFSYGARKWQKADINNWESTFLMFMAGVPIIIVASWLMGEAPLAVENLCGATCALCVELVQLVECCGAGGDQLCAGQYRCGACQQHLCATARLWCCYRGASVSRCHDDLGNCRRRDYCREPDWDEPSECGTEWIERRMTRKGRMLADFFRV